MPYLLIKPKETCNEEKTVCTQNVEQDAGSDAKMHAIPNKVK